MITCHNSRCRSKYCVSFRDAFYDGEKNIKYSSENFKIAKARVNDIENINIPLDEVRKDKCNYKVMHKPILCNYAHTTIQIFKNGCYFVDIDKGKNRGKKSIRKLVREPILSLFKLIKD